MPQWDYYGGRGLRVVPEWLGGRAGFERFLAHIGEPPTLRHELDRIDNDRGYEPGNVRWVTRATQCRNRRSAHVVTVGERSQCIAAWSDETGIPAHTIRARLRNGWSAEAAVTGPVKPRRPAPKNYVRDAVMRPSRTRAATEADHG